MNCLYYWAKQKKNASLHSLKVLLKNFNIHISPKICLMFKLHVERANWAFALDSNLAQWYTCYNTCKQSCCYMEVYKIHFFHFFYPIKIKSLYCSLFGVSRWSFYNKLSFCLWYRNKSFVTPPLQHHPGILSKYQFLPILTNANEI